ncbi:MAG: polymer-forming cytoskeletal protein [Candidatus Thermoplasmatota archaeon]|jgi:predicted acyltransferase (DUF342 family)|nr:polymer-forming cytoskeletal protein [Candidatus Thermoplasmatota archaeon]
MVFDRNICHIPKGTLVEEKTLRGKGDLIISDRCKFSRNVITEGRIFIGEHAEIDGNLISIGDIRVDKGTRVNGNITGDNDVYIGERCTIVGELVVGANMEIGEGVQIDPKAIESKGHVSIRNPISVLIYIFLYLLDLVRKGDEKGVEDFLKELESGAEEELLISREFIYFPRGSRILKDGIFVPGDLRIGPGCHLVGNIESGGKLEMERETQVFGDIISKGSIYLGEDTVINGNVRSYQDIIVHHAARISGSLAGRAITTTSDTIIEGTLKGDMGIRIVPENETQVADDDVIRAQLKGLGELLEQTR